MAMTVGDLRATLEDMEPGAVVRLAFQPRYPLTYDIDDVVEMVKDGEMVVYLTEGGNEQYGSREIFGG